MIVRTALDSIAPLSAYWFVVARIVDGADLAVTDFTLAVSVCSALYSIAIVCYAFHLNFMAVQVAGA